MTSKVQNSKNKQSKNKKKKNKNKKKQEKTKQNKKEPIVGSIQHPIKTHYIELHSTDTNPIKSDLIPLILIE